MADSTLATCRVSAQDGLQLFVHDYGRENTARLPLVCLPGLTRNGRDFQEVARHLSSNTDKPRRVVTIDARGRGGSDHDTAWSNYSPLTEMADVIDVLAATGIAHAAFLGTSRGGILVMLLAAARPTALRAAILNDIGPVVDVAGLGRIRGQLSGDAVPVSWEAAAEALRQGLGNQFPSHDDADWLSYARKTYREIDGRPARDFDVNLLKTLDGVDFAALPPMWPQFAGLREIPTLAIRGNNSDILSADTLASMQSAKSDLNVLEVPDAGHAPRLADEASLTAIARFLRDADAV